MLLAVAKECFPNKGTHHYYSIHLKSSSTKFSYHVKRLLHPCNISVESNRRVVSGNLYLMKLIKHLDELLRDNLEIRNWKLLKLL